MADASVLAIIPVYKDYAQRDRCVEALRAQTVPVEIFEHDNTNNNIGFTKACNLGLREALRRNFRFAMLVNQDCYPLPDAVDKLIHLMDEHPRCAIAGPKELKADDPDEILFAGGGSPYPQSEHYAGRKSQGHGQTSRAVRWVNGACMCVRMEAVVEFGLMDENMFLVGSDSDWCFTARARGWEVWYCAEAEVLHERGVTGRVPTVEQQLIYDRDMHYWRAKWFGTLMHRHLDREVSPNPVDAAVIAQRLDDALADHKAHRFIEAELAYEGILMLDPQNDNAINLLGALRLENGFIALAIDHFRKAIALNANEPRYHIHLGMGFQAAHMFDDARSEYREALRLGGLPPEVLETIANYREKMGDRDDAQQIRDQANALRT